MQYSVTTGYASDQREELLGAIDKLSNLVWPKIPGQPVYELPPVNERPDRYIAVIECGGKVVAEAEGFSRIIAHKGGQIKVQALASVCTDPDFRYKGYAAILVKEIFKLVDNGHYPLSFWQTGVPDFYKKLGATLVANRFYNSLHPRTPEKNPFWEPYMMIYQGNSSTWPQGDIDTLGLGF